MLTSKGINLFSQICRKAAYHCIIDKKRHEYITNLCWCHTWEGWDTYNIITHEAYNTMWEDKKPHIANFFLQIYVTRTWIEIMLKYLFELPIENGVSIIKHQLDQLKSRIANFLLLIYVTGTWSKIVPISLKAHIYLNHCSGIDIFQEQTNIVSSPICW